MTHSTQLHSSSFESLPEFLAQFPEHCDPDFDSDIEELERQFAELRLTFSNQ